MKTKSILMAGLMAVATAADAQDIYKVEAVAGNDLNGTARFVGMGGAMGALGADISVMGTNPAGIGLYRSSDVALSASALVQPDAESFHDVNKARPSFDQMGFVYAAKVRGGALRFVNFGFNYHKSRNFKNYIGTGAVATGGLSQSMQMMDLAYTDHWLDLYYDEDRAMTTPLTCLGYDTQMLLPTYDAQGNVVDYTPCEADAYNYRRVQWGGVQQYDFNVAFNVKDRVYAGLTFGLYNVRMNSFTDYGELLPDGAGNQYEYYMQNYEQLTGNGFDVKLGLIVRPFARSPFRVGLSFATPTYYSLTADASLFMHSPFQNGDVPYTESAVDVVGNEYNVRTPWRLGVSMATTVGSRVALDAEYELANYRKSNISYPDYYDDWGSVYDGETDYALREEIKRFMKPVHTFRVGAEVRAGKGTYLRAGYNYVSAPFEKDAYLNLFTASSSYFYQTNTDYVNLGATNRYTAGLGWRGKHFYADAAYQFQKQTGDLYTFHLPEAGSEANRLAAAPVDLKRHQLLFTVGYKF